MTDSDEDIIGRLDDLIGRAIDRYAELKRKYSLILEEKEEREAFCSELEYRIAGLQKNIEELQTSTDLSELKRYRQKVEQIKQRIQSMLSRLNDLDQLD
ncbi:MAG TPA: hypothetical protein PKN04_06955 [bacterium]|jgi:predicted  nucleic acid-binding Zn-ribbon protein|nr:hypothetical protein [bacterium]HNT65498.1 hypothetical protein [bacterium]HOX87563.1 hypothetical protein [bacterium]HPG47253.1 hypothetical protein [bacterium]HPM99541.1 hypothetical protein [bacterium]